MTKQFKLFATAMAATWLVIIVASMLKPKEPYSCPHHTVGFNEPYPAVVAPNGVEKYECKSGNVFIVKKHQ